MSIQHVLLSQDGDNTIIEKEELVSQLVIPASLKSAVTGHTDPTADRHVAVNKHYYKGKYYAVAAERHAPANEIDDVIELLHPEPLA